MPCTTGKVMDEAEPESGRRLTLAEKACSESDVRTVESLSSEADMMIDWMPIGLIK